MVRGRFVVVVFGAAEEILVVAAVESPKSYLALLGSYSLLID